MKKKSPYQNSDNSSGREAAVKLIKERIQALYGNEKPVSGRPKSDLVDRFWEQNKDNPNPQAAWQRFYSGLSDNEKHHLWNEYHSTTAPKQTSKLNIPASIIKPPEVTTNEPSAPSIQESHAHELEEPKENTSSKLKRLKDKDARKESKQKLIENVKSVPKSKKEPELNKKRRKTHHWRPLFISLSVMGIWLLAQYNPLMIAMAKQYVSPGDTLNSPVIIDPNANIKIGEEPRIIIPKINVDVPVVYELGTRDEKTIQDALEQGVVHYAGTSVPGEAGNNVIVGHSSNNFLNSGKYKFAFVLLDRLELNDTFILHYEGTRYVYKVTNKQTINPDDFSLTLPTATPTATLITCTPPGTSWRRLVIQGEQISPSVSTEQLDTSNIDQSEIETPEDSIVPGNAPSFWERAWNWVF